MLLIILVVAFSLGGSFLCALCEATLYTVTPAQAESMRRNGIAGGSRLARLRSRMHSSIAGLATVNTLTQTVGAAWTGALVGELYGPERLAAFSFVFALAMLLFTEIIPKGIGVSWAKSLAPRLAWTIQAMIWLVWPVAVMARWIMHMLTRRAPDHRPTEQEILIMADLAAKHGEILPDELRWVENVLRLNNIRVRQLMTPRHIVFFLPADLQIDAPELRGERLVHSRIPVTDSTELDRVVGVVQRRNLFDHLIQKDGSKRLRDIMRTALIVDEEWGGHQLLDRLVAERQHMAIVMSNDKLVVGIVTLEDVMEYLLGKPIVGEHDSHPEMLQLARERTKFHAKDRNPKLHGHDGISESGQS